MNTKNQQGGTYQLKLPQLLEAQKLSARAGVRVTLKELENKEWNEVQQADRLIGCSLTGWQDMVNALNFSKEDQIELLSKLKSTAVDAAKEYCGELNINHPLLVTTVKPEGTLSQLPTVSSGVHYQHSQYFIRRVRVSAQDPLLKVCKELGYTIKNEVGQTEANCVTKVIEFYCKAPEGTTKFDVTAIDQLENYKMFMEYYVEHNCSITVTVREEEWEEVEQWVWDNWDSLLAITFLPLSDGVYDLAPYEQISEEEYNKQAPLQKRFLPELISKYENEQKFQQSQTTMPAPSTTATSESNSDQDYEYIPESDCEAGVCPVR